MAAAALLAVLATTVVSSTAIAQSGTDEVRITARKLANNKIEFGLQQHRTDSTWSARLLPTKRFFPPTATTGGWLNSSPLTVTAAGADVTVRITARKLANGKVEFGLQRQAGGSWSGRLLPTNRFFPTTATVGGWLNSSPISATTTTTPSPQTETGFTAVAAGKDHSCALRTNGTTTCWGDYAPDPPDGQYTAITHSCGLRTDGTITCWDEPDPPCDGGPDVCGPLIGTGVVGRPVYTGGPPDDGQYTAITTSLGGFSCALRTYRTTTCWGWASGNGRPEVGPPDGQYTAISGDCGLRTDGTITCSYGDRETVHTRDGQYTAISASWHHSCAIRTNGTITCWDHNWGGQTDAPDGQYTAIATGWYSCALRTDGTIACWDDERYGQTNEYGEIDAPDGQYTAIATGGSHSCALRTDGTIACWGRNDYGQTDAPDS